MESLDRQVFAGSGLEKFTRNAPRTFDREDPLPHGNFIACWRFELP